MSDKSSVIIRQLPSFTNSYEKLKKKYPHIMNDINPFIEDFWNARFLGDRDTDFTYPVYKLRIPNQDQETGLSGGYRLIYLNKENTTILLILLYSKSDQEDLNSKQIKYLNKMIKDFYIEMGWK